jgi:4-hydroxybenzoate polyprenyltransferase
MNFLLAFLRAFRIPNLVMVWVTMYLPYWYILRPAILKGGGIPLLTVPVFNMIAAATVITTLAGYVLNDWFDREIDLINKPGRVFWGKYLSAGTALLFYAALVTAVHVMAVYTDQALNPGNHWPLWLFPGVSFLLFIYAWKLKCTPVAGNLLVSFLCAAVPVITLLPEGRARLITAFNAPELMESAESLIWIYGFFAFIFNYLREQVKDLEDFSGDAACGCNTLAVIKGRTFARKPAVVTGMLVTALTGVLIRYWTETAAPLWQIQAGAATLLLPAAIVTVLLALARTSAHYAYASVLIKIIMFSGTILLIRF